MTQCIMETVSYNSIICIFIIVTSLSSKKKSINKYKGSKGSKEPSRISRTIALGKPSSRSEISLLLLGTVDRTTSSRVARRILDWSSIVMWWPGLGLGGPWEVETHSDDDVRARARAEWHVNAVSGGSSRSAGVKRMTLSGAVGSGGAAHPTTNPRCSYYHSTVKSAEPKDMILPNSNANPNPRGDANPIDHV
jgi:hypothetical protein